MIRGKCTGRMYGMYTGAAAKMTKTVTTGMLSAVPF